MLIPTTLSEANQIILGEISTSSGSITLGLLPLNEQVETACIQLVIEKAGGSLFHLLKLLQFIAPAAASYAIASSASQAVQQGRRFWDPVCEKLGVDISSPVDRKKLSDQYVRTCEKIGVVVPDVSEMSWSHIAPIMAQASILHAWSSPLSDGLRRTLGKHPAPDINDQRSLSRFTEHLSHQIRGTQNLCSILETEIGSIVTHRIVTSFVHNDFNILPYHLIAPLKRAFESAGSAVQLKSPYIRFNEGHSELEIVLPKQANKLISGASYWEIPDRQFSPYEETSILESTVGTRAITIRLRNLAQDFPDQTFNIELQMPDAFMLFDQETRRQKHLKPGQLNAVTPGEYLLLMRSFVNTNDEEFVEQAGKYKILKNIYLRPGSGIWEIHKNDEITSISSSLMTGIFIPRESESSILLKDRTPLLYGEKFEINAIVPKSQHEGSFTVEIQVNKASDVTTKEFELRSFEAGVFDYSDIISAEAESVCQSLDPGIHHLKFKISTNSASASKEVWYWKGLDYVSAGRGFICKSAPQNINFGRSKGISHEGNDCLFAKNFRAPEVIIQIRDWDAPIVIPRPGVQAILISPEDQWHDALQNNANITISNQEKRLIKIQSGGFLQWELFCNSTKLASLTRDKTIRTLSLSALAAEFGDSGTISAENDEGEKVTLFSFTSDLIASDLTKKVDHGLGLDIWETKVPLEKIAALALRITDYTLSPVDESPQLIELLVDSLNEENTLVEYKVSEHLSCRLEWMPQSKKHGQSVKVKLLVEHKHLTNELHFAEFLYRNKDSEAWHTLQCNERVNTSQLCLLINGPAPIEESPAWWRHLYRETRNSDIEYDPSLYSQIPEHELRQGIATISKLAGTKFPTNAFLFNAKYYVSLEQRLIERRKAVGEGDENLWWAQHAHELDDQCRGDNKLATRAFVITSHNTALASMFKLESNTGLSTFTEDCLSFPNSVQAAGGHLAYAHEHYHSALHVKELFHSFENFSSVINGKQQNFESFNFNKFFEVIHQRSEEHESDASDLSEIPILSARHFLHAAKQLKRRARVMDDAMGADADHKLADRVRRINEIHNALNDNVRFLYSGINYSPIRERINGLYQETVITRNFPVWPGLPEVTDDFKAKRTQIADICWSLACITRSKAHGLIPEDQYARIMRLFTDKNPMESPLNIVFTYAPELYVFHVALLDFALLK